GNLRPTRGRSADRGASMGPCWVQHGNTQNPPLETPEMPLQWGRAGFSTETRFAAQDAEKAKRFNGAVLGSARKRSGPTVWAARSCASMGPCWVQHGNKRP